MDSEVIRLTQDALWMMLVLSGPPILAAAGSGLMVAFLQSVTQLQEQTISFAVKLVVICIVLFLMAGFFGESMHNFADRIFGGFPGLLRQG